jgi:hypothetical protein
MSKMLVLRAEREAMDGSTPGNVSDGHGGADVDVFDGLAMLPLWRLRLWSHTADIQHSG